MGYQPIENYGVIGDLQTVALVGLDGSIDFMSGVGASSSPPSSRTRSESSSTCPTPAFS